MSAKKRGRKGVLTPKIREDLLTARENGLNQTECAIYVGLSSSTLSKWLSIGEKAKRGKYRKFWLDWEQSKVKRKAILLQSIFNKSQNGDWKASKYLLECMDPDNFVVENKLTANFKHDESDLALNIREALGILPDENETPDEYSK